MSYQSRLLAMALMAQLIGFGMCASVGAQNVYYSQPKRQTFFQRHPYLKAAGIGVFTGGIGGVLFGAGAAAGAAGGAAKGAGFHFAKEKWDKRHGAQRTARSTSGAY